MSEGTRCDIQDHPRRLVRQVRRRPVLDTLNDEDRVQPQQRRHKREQRAVQQLKRARLELQPQPLPDAGQVDWAVVLRDEEDDRDGETDQEAPLEQGVHAVEHDVAAEHAPHQAVGVHGRAVVGARELLRLRRCADALDVVHDEVLRAHRHEAGDYNGADLAAEHGARGNFAVVGHLLVLLLLDVSDLCMCV